ncbi:T9SS type A sorting domain-containing protein [Taibaiella koreensis]|uniref:T9SS type A sorting domain-containing protein n=1 Tax=Taibaiella koreensis TaxID=1268548 RepID=UPI000E59CFBE|nr:T9SS type A sorting domain-containing protein [Taibaiella koreensis]
MKHKLPFLLCLLLCLSVRYSQAQCGLDIMILNDQSGSVDASENMQARDFILKLAQAHSLGNANTENRIVLSEFTEAYYQYSFPAAGLNYTTSLADIIAYKNAPRSFTGGTNVNYALLRGFQDINETLVPTRQTRKLLLVLTDASPGQASASIIDYAGYVKAAGGIVAVLAIADAVNIPELQTSASSGLYFAATDYVTLNTNATAVISSILSQACSAALPDPKWDLTVTANTFDCNTGTISYTVSNPSSVAFSGMLQTAFYNSNPNTGADLLAVDAHPAENIAAGGSQAYTFSHTSLRYQKRAVAVVNLDTTGGKGATPLPYDLHPRMMDTLEGNPFNNISAVLQGAGCPSGATLNVSNTAVSVGCDKKVTYQVQVCNTGSVAANNVVPKMIPGSHHLVLVSSANDATGTTVQTADMANPGADIATQGYDGYSNVVPLPNPPNGYTSAVGANFKFGPTLTPAYYANGVFTFPPVSAGSGVPFGATILSAQLTAKIAASGDSTIIGGIKVSDAGMWDNSTNHPGNAWEAHPTSNTAPVTGSATPAVQTVEVTAVAQELVNQPDWTNNSAMAFFWHGNRHIFNGAVPVSTLQLTYKPAPNIAPGQCVTYTYVFQDTATTGVADTFNASVAITTSTPGTLIFPDTAFAADTLTGLNGYNGALANHTSDDVIVPAATGCTQLPQAITTTVGIIPSHICAGPGTYVTATVTINNPNTEPLPSGIILHNLIQNLDLAGAGATFASEPYGLTNGLQLARPDVLSPAYPNVAYALSGKSGAQQLPLQQLPPGTSTFKIDLAAGATDFNLSSFISSIPSVYNATGNSDTTQDATGVTINPAPAITWTCPAPVTTGSTIVLSAGAANAASVTLTSATVGVLTNTGSVTTPAATYTPTPGDIANGYAALSVTALSDSGCEASYSCQVIINGVSYDYGDAPSSYDLNDSTVNIAAGCTVLPGLYLGLIAPGTEPAAKAIGTNADGDGIEEDGLLSTVPVINGDTATYQVRVTNNTNFPAYVNGFLDYDGNGNFSAPNKRSSQILVPANSGSVVYNMVFVDTNLSNAAPDAYMRLRLSTDAVAVAFPFGAAPQGEVEDYRVSTHTPLPVALSAFSARAAGCDVALSWIVAAPNDFAFFTAERSGTDNQFHPVATLKYLDTKQAYAIADQAPGAAQWYYRLRLASKDGQYRYSAIAPVNLSRCTTEEAVTLYPNPTADNVTITCAAAITQVALVSLTGNLLYSYNASHPETVAVIDLSNLSPGIYLIRTTNSKGAVVTQKLIRD